MNRAILIAGLVLSIAVLATGTIVPNVEAKGKPTQDAEPTSQIKFSCSDRKGELACKASSRQEVGAYTMVFPSGDSLIFTGMCQRTQPFADNSIETGIYVVTVHECGTNLDSTFEITVNEKLKITSTVQV